MAGEAGAGKGKPAKSRKRSAGPPPEGITAGWGSAELPRGERLDEASLHIIQLLGEDGRMSNRALAAAVGLNEVTVAARIRNLYDRHVLGVTTVFDWNAAGYHWDLWLGVEVEDRPLFQVAEDIAALPSVHSVLLVFGSVDIIVHALLHDRAAVATFLAEEIASVKGVRRATVNVTVETLKYAVNFARVPIAPTELYFPDPAVELSPLDYKIIAALQRDGRESNREIARRLGASDGTVRTRLRRLEQAKMLRICGQTDPYRTGAIRAWAYVGLEVEGAKIRRVVAELAARPDVVVVALTSGKHNVFCYATGRNRTELIQLIAQDFRAINGVRASETWEIIHFVSLDYQWARLL